MTSYKNIQRVAGLSKKEFGNEFVKKNLPAIITDYADSWPAKSKWTLDFFRSTYGHLDVPVFSKNFSKPGKKYMAAEQTMKFGDYLSLIEAGPTEYRLFLFNIFKHAPELKADFARPEIMDGFLMQFPLMFFGGGGSNVQLHFDIDLSHVFHTQFYGQKRVVLFAPDQSKKLYQHPFTVRTPVDIDNPDLEKYPKFREAEGYEDVLQPGETLFMPTGYWHYMHYLTGGYAMSLRANESLARKIKGAGNIVFKVSFDKAMNRLLGQKWNDVKEQMAIRRAG